VYIYGSDQPYTHTHTHTLKNICTLTNTHAHTRTHTHTHTQEDDFGAPSFLFESVVNGDQQGRYSFVGAMPALEVRVCI
jgi:anthranilate/para-aminobenzoate synthase component I